MTEELNQFKIPSLAEAISQSPTQKLGEYLKNIKELDWVFHSMFEKILIAVCFFWGVFSLGSWIWRLLI